MDPLAVALQFMEAFPDATAFSLTVLTEEKRTIVNKRVVEGDGKIEGVRCHLDEAGSERGLGA